MLEYQGWATIREAYNEQGEDDLALKNIIETIEKRIKEISNSHRELGLRYFNGTARLWVMGSTNHKNSDWEQIVSLFKFISDIAPGSYGILSFYDDEDANGKNNTMQIYVLKKGTLTLHDDIFLSPCIPVIEDPNDI